MKDVIDFKLKELAIQELLPAKLPEVIEEESWDYEKSIRLCKHLYKSAKEKSIQLVVELKKAHDKFSKSGNPNTKTETGVLKNYTWKQYCLDIGIHQKTALRWINKYMPISESTRKEKDIANNDSDEGDFKSVANSNSTENKISNNNLNATDADKSNTKINEPKIISNVYKCPHCGKTFNLDELEEIA